MTENEQALLHAAQAGDKVALERLLSGFLAPLYRFGMRMCRNPEDAQDVTQDTLLAAARGLDSFRGASSVSTWLYTIARRACARRRRRRKHAPDSLLSLTDAETSRGLTDANTPTADDLVANGEISAALQRALHKLETPQREVLLLRDVEGLTAPEVAEVLGIKVEAVKSRLHRARFAMRRELEPHLHGQMAKTGTRPACPDVLGLLSRHLEGDIDARTCATMERHLAACPDCRAECDSLKQTLALCRDHPAPLVPASVQQQVRQALADALARKLLVQKHRARNAP